MKHILFTPPYLWEDDLQTIDVGDKTVAWLLAVPIAHTEYLLAQERGVNVLERRLEKHSVNIFDLDRPCVA